MAAERASGRRAQTARGVVAITLALAAWPAAARAMPADPSAALPSADSSDATSPAPSSDGADAARSDGTIVVSASSSRADPAAPLNKASFAAVQTADRIVIGPAAMAYGKVLPAPVRDGVHNVIYNLREPVTIVNCLLQHRVGRAGRALARLTLNTTVGLGGLFDVARRHPFGIPFRFNGFGNTLGFYGVGAGPYMFLPVFGPTTVRDLAGTLADNMFLPTLVGKPLTSVGYRIPSTVLGVLDDRLVKDARIRDVRSGARNPYLATRDAYLAGRREDIAALHRPDHPAP